MEANIVTSGLQSNKKARVVVCGLSVGPEIEPLWADLSAQTDLTIVEELIPDAQKGVISEADVLIVRGAKISREIIEKAERLKGIVVWGVGYDKVDVAAATERGIPVVTLPVFLASMAEAVFYFMLLITKKYNRLNQLIRTGGRPSLHDRGRALEGKMLGCVGLGRIGRRVARIALALDMNILVYDPYLEEAVIAGHTLPLVSLDDLLKQSDFVSLHAPLTVETFHLIDAGALSLMKSEACLINVARGALVDESALYNALVKGKLAGAALDVFETEPVSPENPLLALDNVWATPHYLGSTREGLAQVALAAQDAALKILGGEQPGYNLVNPQIYGEEE